CTLTVYTSGCTQNGGIILTQDGAYENDVVLVNYDESAKAAHQAIDKFLRWEELNRVWLEQNAPDVCEFADRLRIEAPKAFTEAARLRRAYLAARSIEEEAGKATMELND